eukprot:TRINITY_DN6547_c0_g5_i1.p1 TRINITY_DN6547_c0_g5~~TRINITY_DN6547_c0_g5_i1.p1  ORF type:complete len:229 (-),score=33.46 TRINITY_DN6547_c0_g5_i1:113-799(-)
MGGCCAKDEAQDIQYSIYRDEPQLQTLEKNQHSGFVSLQNSTFEPLVNNHYEEPEHLLKFILIGDNSVGKSSILSRFVGDGFDDEVKPTLGIDLKVKNIIFNGKQIKLQIWDTADQDQFRSVTETYYKHAQGILIIYDVTKSDSIQNLPNWVQKATSYGSRDSVVAILGNKIDLEEKRKVSFSEGQEFAVGSGALYFEVSAREDSSKLDEIFEQLVERILENQGTFKS